MSENASDYWDGRYRERERMWSGNPNAALVAEAAGLEPGSALDLGCGEGADSIWLAQQGWRVTGLDVSRLALERAAEAAASAGVGDRIRWVGQNLAEWHPSERYELVSACFLHSPIELPRTEVLRRAADAVAPGGRLLIVGHRAPPPWSSFAEQHEEHQGAHAGDHAHATASPHDAHDFLSPSEEVAALDLPAESWSVERAETRTRDAVSPDGATVQLEDSVVVLRRNADA